MRRNRQHQWLVGLLIWGLGLSGLALAGEEPVKATLFTRDEGGVIRAALQLEIRPHWKMFHEKLGPDDAFEIPAQVVFHGGGAKWTPARFPDPLKETIKFLGDSPANNWRWVHKGRILIYAAGRPIPGKDGLPPQVRLHGQACSESGTCVELKLEIATAGAGPDEAFAAFPAELLAAAADSTEDADRPLVAASTAPEAETFKVEGLTTGESPATMYLLAFLAGLLLNVMPCVLPVLSLRVLGLVQQAGENPRRAAILGFVFAAGVLAVFAALGGLAAGFRLGWGEQFQSQTFLIIMVAVVFGFALSLFGVYEILLPGNLGGGAPRAGYLGAFGLGMLATVLATPCSGPFLGSTLAWALKQPPAVIMGVFLTMGLGMASPYALLTAHPAFLKLIPRPGAWLDTFKKVMGFLLVGTAVYLMRALDGEIIFYVNVFLLHVALAGWLWGRYGSPLNPGRTRAVAAGATALVLIGAWHLSFNVLYVPAPAPATGLVKPGWEAFRPERFAELRAAGRNILVEFTATWCTNCKVNDKLVYDTEDFRELVRAKKVALLLADLSHSSPAAEEAKEFRERAGGGAVPFLAVFPADRPGTAVALPDLLSPERVREVLRSLPGGNPVAAGAGGN